MVARKRSDSMISPDFALLVSILPLFCPSFICRHLSVMILLMWMIKSTHHLPRHTGLWYAITSMSVEMEFGWVSETVLSAAPSSHPPGEIGGIGRCSTARQRKANREVRCGRDTREVRVRGSKDAKVSSNDGGGASCCFSRCF